jgi:O-antigen/teichoic acid export membrane protein
MGSLQMLYYRVDVVMIKSFLGNAEVALYANAYKLLEAALQLGDKAAWALLPALAFRRMDAKAFGRLSGEALRWVVLGGVLTASVGYAVAPYVLSFLFDRPYAAAGTTSSILFLSALPFFLNALAVAVMTVRNPKKLVFWYLSLLAANVFLNVWLIPRYGIVGAAWATLICEVGGAVVSLRWILRETTRDFQTGWIRMGMGACLGAAAIFMGAHFLPGVQWLVLGPAVFLLSLVGTRSLGREDWGTLKGLFGRP